MVFVDFRLAGSQTNEGSLLELDQVFSIRGTSFWVDDKWVESRVFFTKLLSLNDLILRLLLTVR